MVASGIQQLLHMKSFVDIVIPLGYPMYFLTILGVWKILGVIAILVPRFPLVKEWAYAGFFFIMTGAVFSHLINGDEAIALFGPTLLLILTAVSWYFRPADRRLIPVIN
jgi:uncharacterized membrane protein YphA (DoxX/SURF4 family)